MGPKKKNRNLDDWDKEFGEVDENGELKEPEVLTKPASKSKKKDKKKNKKAAAFESDDEEPPVPVAAPDTSEDEVAEDVPVRPSKRASTKSAPNVGFALLGDDEDEGEESEEEELPVKSGGSGFSFGLLGDDGEGDTEGEDDEASSEVASEPVPVAARVISVKAHPKADKLRIVKLAAGPAYGDVQVVTNATNFQKHQIVALAPVGCTTPGTAVAIATTKLRGVESTGMLCSAHDLGWAEESDGLAVVLPKDWTPGQELPRERPPQLAQDASDGKEGEPADATPQKKAKKKKSCKDAADTDALFAALAGAEHSGEPATDGADAHATASAFEALTLEDGDKLDLGAKKKKKKKSKTDAADLDLDALLAGDKAPESKTEQHSPAPGAPRGPPAKQKKKGKAVAVDDELDALLAELEAPAPKPEPKKGKGKGKAKAKEEDLDALLAEFGVEQAPQPAPEALVDVAATKPAEAREEEKTAAVAAAAEPSADDAAEASQPAAAKKKSKRKSKKAAGTEAGDEPGEASEKAAPAKGKKVSAAVRRMQEALEAQRRAEEEEARRIEEERLRVEEEERRAEEEARLAAEEAERKKAERKAHREQLKREGKLLTGKAKAEQERLARMREQFLKQAGIDSNELAKPKKPVYGNRRKFQQKRGGPPQQQADEAPAVDGATALEPGPAVEEKAVPELEEKEQAGEEVRPAASANVVEKEENAAEALAPAATTVPAVDDWDALDEDSITIPGLVVEQPRESLPETNGKAPTPAAALAPTPAAALATTDAPDRAAASSEEQAASESETESESESESESETETESESESDSESESESEIDSEEEMEERVEAQRALRAKRRTAAMAARKPDDLRSPICCILGHVDTGKTKILDNIRRTNVQDGEAGGITQQIGATYVPGEAVMRRTEELREGRAFELRVPGLLVIDTPGHESFSNLRSRGSGLCDIAVLVVDLMHGLEPQTIESIGLLRMRKTPFIIALNKVDRLYGWQSSADGPILKAMARQKEHVRQEFEQRADKIMLELNEQGLNVALYWKNRDPRTHVSIVPTSAVTGEGIPDLLQLLVKLTQTAMTDRLMFVDDLECTVLEVKSIEGLGTTVDVVLINGQLSEGDTIVVCGLGGAVVTTVRALLTPQPLREIRVKGTYVHHKTVRAAMGVKIAAHNLETAVAGTQLFVVRPGDDVAALEHEVMEDMQDIFSSVDKTGEGVCVQASTLGSLEALLTFLQTPAVAIPVSAINIGPVHKRDVMRANVMIERGARKFGVILAFDVPVTREARELAEELGVVIFTADIIYHLFDQFTAYLKRIKEEEQEAARLEAVFPCVLRILPTCVFNKKAPIVVGVEVAEGIAKVGAPLCVPSQGGFELGRIASMEKDHKAVDVAKRGDTVAMKIDATTPEQAARLYGRHFDYQDELVSKISRKSIDILKDMFRDELTKDDWRLVIKLKKIFNID